MDAPLSAELHSPTFRVSCSKKHPMKSHLVTIVSLSFLCHPGFLVTQKWVINVSHWAEWVLFLFLLFGTPFYRGISVKCGILCFFIKHFMKFHEIQYIKRCFIFGKGQLWIKMMMNLRMSPWLSLHIPRDGPHNYLKTSSEVSRSEGFLVLYSSLSKWRLSTQEHLNFAF